MNIKKLSAIFLCLIILFLSACGENTSHPEDEVLSFNITSDPLTLDPQVANDYSGIMLITNIFEGLVRTDGEGSIIPAMAENWDISNDGLTYTFHLVEDTKWSNGTPVTANDFVFGITRALSPNTNSENASDLFAIKNASAFFNGEVAENDLGIKAKDLHTLEIELEYETNGLLLSLTEPVAMPCNEEFFNTTKGKYGKDDDLIITNGPFQIRENYGWDHESYIYIRRSENYTGPNTAVPLGVNFNYAAQPDDPIAAVSNGDIDLCEIYGSRLSEAKEENFNITTISNTLWGICFNTNIKAFKNAKLRVSLLGSLDRDALLQNAPESFVKTSQLISDDVLFAGKNYREIAGKITLSPADNADTMFNKALEELEENEIELKSSYTIIYLDDETSSEIVTSIIEAWNETTSCYFNKEALSRSELEDRMASGDYEIAIAPLNTAVDSPMEFFTKFVKDSPDNYINLNYPTYDEFIDTALSETGDKAIDALSNAESYLVDYGYLYPLYYENRYFITAGNVSGVIFSSTSEAIDFTQITKLTED